MLIVSEKLPKFASENSIKNEINSQDASWRRRASR